MLAAFSGAFEQRLPREPLPGSFPARSSPLRRTDCNAGRQGYDLGEVARELGKLNECVVLELNLYAKAHSNFSLDALTRAQQIWTALCSTCIEESVSQYFALQQQEAGGHVKDLAAGARADPRA